MILHGLHFLFNDKKQGLDILLKRANYIRQNDEYKGIDFKPRRAPTIRQNWWTYVHFDE